MSYFMRGGLREGSTQNFLIGPGMILTNFDLTKFKHDDETTWGNIIGATSGGNKINIDLTYHWAEIDGAIGKVKGAGWLTEAAATVESTLLEASKENIQLLLPSFQIEQHDEQYDKISHDGSVAPPSVQNVAIVAEKIGSQVPIVFVLTEAVATSPFELDLNNGKDSVKIPVTIEGLVTELNPTRLPFYILYPRGSSPAVPPQVNPPAGIYTDAQTVTLSGPPGATIYYTVDGSFPTPQSGLVYDGTPITVTQSMTIKVITAVGADLSTVMSYDYTINA